MFEETAPRRRGALPRCLLIALILCVLRCLPSLFSGAFSAVPYLGVAYDLFTVAILAFFVYRLWKDFGTEYRYQLKDAIFSVRAKNGIRDYPAVSIDLRRISDFGPASEEMQRKKPSATHVVCGVCDRKKAYFISFSQNGTEISVLFQPSKEFVKLLQQKRLDIAAEKLYNDQDKEAE